MHEEFNRIIGYEAVKRELAQICDVLKFPEKYRKLGVTASSGLVLVGEPGLGKSLMAECLIKASERKTYTCRKDLPNGEFVKMIKKTFDDAAANPPSIVFLDDMDKFANGDDIHPNSEEYVTVQSCIDQVKGKGVFVVATANDLDNLPDSLLRSGRFDRTIKVKCPTGADARAIIRHYLKGKPVHPDIDVDLITSIMEGRSCAELESVLNEAGRWAVYSGSDTITMEHFLEACLPIIFHAPGKRTDEESRAWQESLNDANSSLAATAYHEAGHLVVAEVLNPGSVALASVYQRNGREGGFISRCGIKKQFILAERLNSITVSLGGIAATDQKFGYRTVGGASDLSKAVHMMEELVADHCIYGMGYYRAGRKDSAARRARQEDRISDEVERLYQRAKTILAANIDFLDAAAKALAAKGILTAPDIAEIKDSLSVLSTSRERR